MCCSYAVRFYCALAGSPGSQCTARSNLFILVWVCAVVGDFAFKSTPHSAVRGPATLEVAGAHDQEPCPVSETMQRLAQLGKCRKSLAQSATLIQPSSMGTPPSGLAQGERRRRCLMNIFDPAALP